MSENYSKLDGKQIEAGVTKSFNALQNLFESNTIQMERQPNTENNLYLKLMERAHEENSLNLINIANSKQY